MNSLCMIEFKASLYWWYDLNTLLCAVVSYKFHVNLHADAQLLVLNFMLICRQMRCFGKVALVNKTWIVTTTTMVASNYHQLVSKRTNTVVHVVMGRLSGCRRTWGWWGRWWIQSRLSLIKWSVMQKHIRTISDRNLGIIKKATILPAMWSESVLIATQLKLLYGGVVPEAPR